MNVIRHWAIGICFAVTAAGLCGMIAPKQGTGKVLRFVLSLFFLSSILFPLKTASFSYNDMAGYSQEAKELSQEIALYSKDRTQYQVEQQIAQQIFQILSKQGITPVRLSIDMVQKEQENEVQVVVYLKERDFTAEEWIKQNLQSGHLEVSICCEEGENINGGETE